MLIHLRLVVPGDLSEAVRRLLLDDPRVTDVTFWHGACLQPEGDLIQADVAREAGDDIVGRLHDLGLDDRGAISVSALQGTPFTGARRVEAAAAGEADDGVIWDVVLDEAEESARGSLSYYAFLVLATALAAVAVITDSPIVVVGAMVVGPDFAPVAAACAAIALGRWRLAGRALALLFRGYVVAVAVITLTALVAAAFGEVDAQMIVRPRPATSFIWHPDRWSFVVALLAGAAGALAMTASKSNALIGVFISVTTVPAAGALSLALATGVGNEIRGSLAQLAVNVAGMLISGVAVMLAQRWAVARFHLATRGPRRPGLLSPTRWSERSRP